MGIIQIDFTVYLPSPVAYWQILQHPLLVNDVNYQKVQQNLIKIAEAQLLKTSNSTIS